MKRNIVLFFMFCFLNLMFVSNLQAAYLKNIPRTLIQPNGDTLHCFVSGDEFYNYLHDANNFTIIQHPITGFYVYAQKEGSFVVPTQYVANSVNPAEVGLKSGATISPETWMARRNAFNEQTPLKTPLQNSKNSLTPSNPNHGHLNNLVVFIRFSSETNLSTGYSSVVNMFNDSTVSANSMYNYFKSTSYNQLFITSSFYPAPSGNTILSYQDIYERAYYMPYSATNTIGYNDDSERTSREHGLLQRAVNFISSSVPTSLNIDYDNDGYVDNVCFVVKGNVGDWNDLLWPHRWALYSHNVYINSKRVYDYNFMLEGSTYYFSNAVLCHEMQHTLSYPDLYHYYENILNPVGIWDIMESTGTPPQNSGAYMKYKYGNWIDSIPLITPGNYTLNPLGTSATGNAYKIQSEIPGQFFVLEYRNNSSQFESALSGSGLVIYRINDSFSGNASYNGTSTFDEVYVFRPNGTTSVDGNLSNAYFSSQSGRTSFGPTTNPRPFFTDGTYSTISISNITSAGSTISFTYNGLQPSIMSSANNLNLSGYLPTGAPSQSVSITGLNLTDSITITATTTFQISKNNSTWFSTLKLPTSGGTLYIKYNSMVLGSHTGTVTLTSGTATPISISLNGTICDAISVFPFTEGFESGTIPTCWTQSYVTGQVNWIYQNGGHDGGTSTNHPANAHTGSFNALFYHDSNNGYKSRLVTPALNLSSLYNPQLTFWRAHPAWGGDIDYLRVYYKTSPTGNWTLINAFTTNISSWAFTELDLPNPSATYFIAFEGVANYGYGVSIDDISVTGLSGVMTITATSGPNGTISPSGNVAVSVGNSQNFTFTPNSGYMVDSVFINGNYVGRFNSYQINNVIANHSIHVTFKVPNAAIQVNPDSLNFQTVISTPSISTNVDVHAFDLNDPIVITAPQFFEVSLNSTVWQNSITLPHNANQSIFVRFNPSTIGTIVDSLVLSSGQSTTYVTLIGTASGYIYTILSMSNAGGTIDPVGNVFVEEGDNQSFTMTPETGFILGALYIDDQIVDIQNPYTFSSVNNGHIIYAYFVDPTKIDDQSWDENIVLYPNPVQNTLYIRQLKHSSSTNITYQLFDVAGKIISTQEIYNDVLSLDVSSLSQGIYFIKFITPEGNITKKIFKY